MTEQNPAPDAECDLSLETAAVAHDVNQMLAVITGRAGLLLKRTKDPDLARHLQAILLASGDAATMLRRLRRGTADETAGSADAALREVAEQAHQLVWPETDAAYQWDNQIAAGVTGAMPAQILREVLSNLLLNAMEAMPAGGRVTLSATPAGGERLLLKVTDNGPGIPAGDPEQIFVPGVSGSGQKGRGLGLTGCRRLLASVGAQLRAEPHAGEGAVFVLDLPVGMGVQESVATGETPVTSLRVLVVDDEAGVREMLHDVLVEWGCEVQACRDGRTTLAEYETGSAELALIDQNLPGLSGLELATRLRVGDPCLSIVMVTGWEQDDSLAGADPTVVDRKASKPLELKSLRDILRESQQLNSERRAAASPE